MVKECLCLLLELFHLLNGERGAVRRQAWIMLFYLLFKLMQGSKLLAELLNLGVRAVLRPVNQFLEVNRAALIKLKGFYI